MVVDAYCKDCQYLGGTSAGKCCNYMEIVGQRRGCPAGKGCNRRKKGARKRLPGEKITLPGSNLRFNKPKEQKPEKPPETEEERAIRLKATSEKRKEYKIAFRARVNGRQQKVIQEYRDSRGLTNAELAAEIGVTQKTVERWIIEESSADWKKLAKLGIAKPEGI